MFKSEWIEGGKVSWRYNRILLDLCHIEHKHSKCLNQLRNTRSIKVVKGLNKRLSRYAYQHSKLQKKLKELHLLELISPKE